MRRDEVQGTAMPYVDPALTTNPAAMRYAQAMAARKQTATLQQSPPIPRLDQPGIEGMTMADQARYERMQAGQGPSILQTPNQFQQHPSVRPTDILPETARSDPGFRQGLGDMYAANQPHLAMKYGVVRDGKLVPPTALIGEGQPKPGLSQQTVAGLQALSDFNRQRQHIESGDAAIEQAVFQGPMGEAAKLADPSPNPDPKPISEEEARGIIEQAREDMDDFDFNAFHDFLMKDILNNREQKEIVEARLKPMDVAEAIEKGYAVQTVPIVPGKWEPTFQSLSVDEDLAIKRLLTEEIKIVGDANIYVRSKHSVMVTTAALRAINKRELPDHRDASGKFNKDLFWKKFEHVARFPFHMLCSASVHAMYFEIRVRTLWKAIKNG